MVLIYSNINSPRLQYICSFIFKELLSTNFIITNVEVDYLAFKGTKINYSNQHFFDAEFRIKPVALLFENNIIQQKITCFYTENFLAFYQTINSSYPFDIFAATFFLLSRYEEYLPHQKDRYGRYEHENSIAYINKFLDQPLINIWVKDFGEQLKKQFQFFNLIDKTFSFEPTYDIDIAYSFLHKGWKRNMGGFLKNPSLKRLKVLAGLSIDPFDVYDWLDELHHKNNLKPTYFFLLAKQNGLYDKNILPNKNAMIQLIKKHASLYTIGIHPSWKSGDEEGLLQAEKKLLETISALPIVNSRQHYIRFLLPLGYTKLIEAGITDDYSMGYGSINGFRASVATTFFWYNLHTEQQTVLRIHPFCYMEANSFYEQKLTANEAYLEMLHYYNICKKVNGKLITIWHNHFLGTDKKFKGWKEIYMKFIAQVQQ